MARHNRDGRGRDQLGYVYAISYQPDWLKQIKVTRELPGGRRSTRILFRNTVLVRKSVDGVVRTTIASPEQGLFLEAATGAGDGRVRSVVLEWEASDGGAGQSSVVFSIEAFP